MPLFSQNNFQQLQNKMKKLKNLALGKKTNKQKDSGSTHQKRPGGMNDLDPNNGRRTIDDNDMPTAKLYHAPTSARHSQMTGDSQAQDNKFLDFQENYFESRLDRQSQSKIYQKRKRAESDLEFLNGGGLSRYASAAVGLADQEEDEDIPMVEQVEADTYNYAGRLSKQSYLQAQNNQDFEKIDKRPIDTDAKQSVIQDDIQKENKMSLFFNDMNNMRDNDEEPQESGNSKQSIKRSIRNDNDADPAGGYADTIKKKQSIKGSIRKDPEAEDAEEMNDLVFDLDQMYKDKEEEEKNELERESLIGGSGLKFSLADKARRKRTTVDDVAMMQMGVKPYSAAQGADIADDGQGDADQNLEDEEADKVNEMDNNDFFNSDRRLGQKKQKSETNQSDFNAQEGQVKGAANGGSVSQSKEQQIGKAFDFNKNRARGLSYIQEQRKRRRETITSQQEDSSQNSRKNHDPRATLYNEKAQSHIDKSLQISDKNNEQLKKEMMIELKKYQEIVLNSIDNQQKNQQLPSLGDKTKSEIVNSKNNNFLKDYGGESSQSEIQQQRLLEDFYKQMDIDAENQFNLHLEKKQGLEAAAQQQQTDNDLVNGHIKISEQDKANKRRHDTFYEHFKEDFTQESIDMIRFIDWNERRHIVEAQQFLNKNSQITRKSLHTDAIQQHMLTPAFLMKDISHKLAIDRQVNGCKPTSIAITDELILVGNSAGELSMFDRETQEPYTIYQEKSKEFQGNAISAIDVHPTRPEYVAIGYSLGQIVLLDLTSPEKALKIIKDHHQKTPIANICFCDWTKSPNVQEKQNRQFFQHGQLSGAFLQLQSNSNNAASYDDQGMPENSPYMQSQKQNQQVDLQAWMIASIDYYGRVIVSTITKNMLYFKTNKQVLIEPQQNEAPYTSLSARFKNEMHPSHNMNDCVTLLAVGNADRVVIFALSQKEVQPIKEIIKPVYLNIQIGQHRELKNCRPSICWGYGHSPVCKDKCYSTMVVGWGPLIQLYILNDIMDAHACFFEDGHHVMIPDEERSQPQSSKNQPGTYSNKNADMSPFELEKLFVEQICYLSESILLVMTRQLEFKLFYTQNLAHSNYTEEKSTKAALYDPEHYQKQRHCQIDCGMFVNQLAESRFGQLYNQTLCVYNGMIVGLSAHGVLQYNHLRWDDSLQEFKKIVRGNWIQLFQRAIDIYIGRVKGFKDVPEEQFMRQETMKAELKLLIRNIITQQMEMWAVERTMVQRQAQIAQQVVQQTNEPANDVDDDEDDNPYASSSKKDKVPKVEKVQSKNQNQQEAFTDLDDEQLLTDLNSLSQQEKSKEMAERYRTLLRIAIEFCVTIQDCYFLFYDLFLMFQEESLESIFLDELKPFIMAGRFYDWDLPGDILQNHIVKYYIMQERPDIVEKLIINLSFIDCPKSFLLELAEYCEDKCLCTGLLYLQTAVSQTKAESFCVPVITTLLQLYRNAKRTNPGTLDEIKCIKDLSSDSQERIRAEKSQIYLGYKILWAIRLFLNGKYFPIGNIPEKQWKKYVLELVDCISQSQIMLDLLYIDSEAYFQIVSIIFYKGKVFDFIKQGSSKKQGPGRGGHQIISDEVFNELMGGNLSQKQILERFDAVCQSKEEDGYVVPDEIRLQYLFFVANVPSANNSAIEKEPLYYYQCIMQLLRQSQKFLRFNKNLIKRALTRKGRMQSMDKNFSLKQIDEQKYIIAGENALIALLKHCEPLSSEQINQLLIMTEYSKFSHLRVKLLEMKGDYVKCLQLFVEGMKVRNYVANPDSANRVFEFIRERLNHFDMEARRGSSQDGSLETSTDLATSSSTVKSSTSQNNSKQRSAQEDQFRTQIIDSFASLVKIDQKQSFQLVDRFFKDDQERIFEALNGHNEEQFLFLDTMFGEQNDQIQSLIEKHLMSALENQADSERAEQLMKLQKLHFKLLCQVNPTGVIDRVRQIKRNEIKLAPVDCLDICEQFKQIEACAMLSNRISSYLASVTYYMQLVTQKEYFNFPLLIKQLGDLAKSGQSIPIFIPYFAKQDTRKHKLIMKAAALAEDKENKSLGMRAGSGQEELQGLDLSTSQIIRFDYVIRKAMKICVIESKENQNFDNIDKTWFFVLESMFNIRQYQTQIVKLLQEQSSEKQKLVAKDAENKQINYLKCFEEFFQTRLDFVIEQSLNHIELKVFLERVVGHDKDLKFSDLRQMITNIFTEVRSEAQVLVNAQQTARLQITTTFENCGQNKTNGILFRYRQCNKCNRFLDEEIRDKKKKMELLQYAKKGSFISPSIIGAYKFDNDSDEDIFESADQLGFYAGDKMKLFPCGHAFHIQCIVKHAKERAEIKLQQINSGPQGSRNAGKGQNSLLQIAKKIYDEQKCPWCYSDQYAVEFEPTLKKQNERNRNANFANRYNKQFGLGGDKSSTTDESSDLFSFSEDEGANGNPDIIFSKPNQPIMSRTNISPSVIRRHKKDQFEQRLEQFDLALVHEGVTLF